MYLTYGDNFNGPHPSENTTWATCGRGKRARRFSRQFLTCSQSAAKASSTVIQFCFHFALFKQWLFISKGKVPIVTFSSSYAVEGTLTKRLLCRRWKKQELLRVDRRKGFFMFSSVHFLGSPRSKIDLFYIRKLTADIKIYHEWTTPYVSTTALLQRLIVKHLWKSSAQKDHCLQPKRSTSIGSLALPFVGWQIGSIATAASFDLEVERDFLLRTVAIYIATNAYEVRNTGRVFRSALIPISKTK